MSFSEILSPAGSFDSAVAAVRSGADAVYLGLKRFSARSSAANFTDDELRDIVGYCHERGVKVYAAVNTMLFDSEISDCADTLRMLCETGVDAVIVQDLAVAYLADWLCPDLELHASTQMTLHTANGCKFAGRLGYTRTVLSRELPFDIIASLSGGKMETEVFVHGALCMSVSGQCLMSAAVGGRSANRGMCAQPCRLPWSVKRRGEDYALSLKDMSCLKDLPRLAECGVDSMKIEGRMKRPEYAALSANCAVKARSGEDYDESLLESVFSRGGFTDGYLRREVGSSMFGRRTKDDAKNAAAAYPKIHELYRREYKRSRLDFFVSVKEGEPLKITVMDENGLCAEYVGNVPQQAVNRPCDAEYLKKQLSKLGDTFYELDSLTADIGDGLAVPSSELNNARRTLAESILELRREHYSRVTEYKYNKAVFSVDRRSGSDEFRLRLNVCRAQQLSQIDPQSAELVFLPLDIKQLTEAVHLFPVEKLGVSMPAFTFNEEQDTAQLREAAKLGIKHILCNNFAHIIAAEELKEYGIKAHASARLNTANTPALRKLEQLGIHDAELSCEMKASQINAVGDGIEIGVRAYGRLPLMLTANCPIRAAAGCKNCTGKIYDRTGREFPVKCSKRYGYVEILNSDILCISDKLSDFRATDFLYLDFYNEKPERVSQIVKLFENGEPYPYGGALTRGLYYRGLKSTQ